MVNLSFSGKRFLNRLFVNLRKKNFATEKAYFFHRKMTHFESILVLDLVDIWGILAPFSGPFLDPEKIKIPRGISSGLRHQFEFKLSEVCNVDLLKLIK